MAQYLETLEVPETAPVAAVQPAFENLTDDGSAWVEEEIEVSRATYQAYRILYFASIVLFAAVGLDKFLHVLADWEQFVSPGVASVLHLTTGGVATLAGLVELMIAGAIAIKPRYGSWAMTLWLWLIAIDLISMRSYDQLLQVLALSAAGFAFTRLSAECN